MTLPKDNLGLIFLSPFSQELIGNWQFFLFNLLIAMTCIRSQLSSKFDYFVHLALELLALECLNNPYLIFTLLFGIVHHTC